MHRCRIFSLLEFGNGSSVGHLHDVIVQGEDEILLASLFRDISIGVL